MDLPAVEGLVRAVDNSSSTKRVGSVSSAVLVPVLVVSTGLVGALFGLFACLRLFGGGFGARIDARLGRQMAGGPGTDVRVVELLLLVVDLLARHDRVLNEGLVMQDVAVGDDQVAVLADLDGS